MLTHIDLFSGIGGFALAARWAGFKTVCFVEIEPYGQEILKKNFGAVADARSNGKRHENAHATKPRGDEQANGILERGGVARLFSDIQTFDGTRYRGATLLTGGFPCQPFSQAGKRRGKEDDRYLWPQMLRVISEARPRWVVGENVAGIIGMELDRVLSDLESEGYTCQALVIPACAVDAKHRRDRVWIMGHAEHAERRQSEQCRRDFESRYDGTGQASSQFREPSQDVADAAGSGSGNNSEVQAWRELGGRDSASGRCVRKPANDCPARWLPEPDVGRVANGVPRRVDRLKGLGNAIVPQVAYEILRGIAEIECEPNT